MRKNSRASGWRALAAKYCAITGVASARSRARSRSGICAGGADWAFIAATLAAQAESRMCARELSTPRRSQACHLALRRLLAVDLVGGLHATHQHHRGGHEVGVLDPGGGGELARVVIFLVVVLVVGCV